MIMGYRIFVDAYSWLLTVINGPYTITELIKSILHFYFFNNNIMSPQQQNKIKDKQIVGLLLKK